MGGKEKFHTDNLIRIFTTPPEFKVGTYGRVTHEMTEMVLPTWVNMPMAISQCNMCHILYDYSGQPWKTQKWVRKIMDKLYSPTPDGLCGDEDNGQMSAWYVFSAMGFYPVCPGRPTYVLGAPLFKKITISFDNGKKFVIEAPDNSPQDMYVESRT